MAASTINKLVIPKDVEDDLKCSLCSNCLSVPTVKIFDVNDGCYICGRCSDKFPGKGLRASAYEAVAKLLIFPCRYAKDGCTKQTSWGAVGDHEQSCEFRLYDCPMLPIQSCKWRGPIKNMVAHFMQSHKMFYMPLHYFIIPMNESEQFNKILTAFDEVFLLQYTHESTNKCYITVKYLGKPANSGKYNYEIEIKGGNDENVLKLCNKTTKPTFSYEIDAKSMNETDLDSLRSILKATKISCHIKIQEKAPSKVDVKKPDKAQKKAQKPDKVPQKSEVAPPKPDNKKAEKIAKVKSSNKDIDANLLAELECPVCQDYMIPPIFICATGHSICITCKDKLKNCPTCRAVYSGARNFTLEKLTAIVKYPCKYEVFGCMFAGNSTVIQKHEVLCQMAYVKCPLDVTEQCNWRGSVKDIYAHSKQQHAALTWITMNELLFRNLTSPTCADINIVSFDDELFKFCCKHSKSLSGTVHWTVQHIGLNANEKPRYKFEIEFVDQSKAGRKFVINDLCYEATEYKDIFQKGLQIPANLLSPYMNRDNCIIFKYNMERV